MTEEFEDKTDIQARESVSRYIGRWLFVDEEITDVRATTFGDSVTVFAREDDPHIHLRFEREWKIGLTQLQKGTRIVAAGRIADVERWYIRLEDCEIYYHE